MRRSRTDLNCSLSYMGRSITDPFSSLTYLASWRLKMELFRVNRLSYFPPLDTRTQRGCNTPRLLSLSSPVDFMMKTTD
ncbi:hypothetical protein T02_8355 [Trichinella nativa]|uniref:Uncharacterized protein n=1 Tax=Trichinella nativa TaxID=6335 RepID=A0A0V1KIT3_9BILA|nr:hypothetical protein T02_8355 [Trichinella nativa]